MPQIKAVSFSFPSPLDALLVTAGAAVDGLGSVRWRMLLGCDGAVDIKISGIHMVDVAEGEGSRYKAVGWWLEEVADDVVSESLKLGIGGIEKGKRG